VEREITPSELNNIKTYILRKLGPKLGHHSGQLDFEVLGLPKKSRTVVLCRSDHCRFVVKLYDRFNVFRKAKKNLEFFIKRHLPCPSILHSQVFPGIRAGHRRFLLVEEEISGISLREIDIRDEAIARIGKILAAMHGHSRKYWGPLFTKPKSILGWRRGSHADYLFESAMRQLDKMELQGEMTSGEAKHLADTLENARSQLPKQSRHELIHGDVTSDHFLLLDKEVFMIDLERAKFGHFAWELVVAEHHLCKSDHEKRLLLRSYFSEAAHTTPEFYNEVKPFFELVFSLKHASGVYSEVQKEERI